MRTTLAFLAAIQLASWAFAEPLTPAEKAAGWKYLFDGSSTANFRSYRKDAFPAKGWAVEDGALRVIKAGGGGDIVTVDEYEDFELSLEFKCAPGANSGIMYRVAESKDYPWMTGPEFQILDDSGHKDGLTPSHSVGALYDLIAPPTDKPATPPDTWNHARIRIRHGVLTHFLNGVKTAECRIDDDQWATMIAGSKFKQWPGFGLEKKGRLALQDHGDDVWYRNIKVRDLGASMPDQVTLFDGKNGLEGWLAYLPEITQPHIDKRLMVWNVNDDRVLVCKGKPSGYLFTTKSFTNFVLKLQWRWTPENPGNSGVLFRLQEPHNVWPKSIEAQLHSGSAGDFWNIGEFQMTTDPDRTKGRNTKRLATNERPLGEWNEYEIIADGPNVTLNVNGMTLNTATNCAALAGPIALQSEGAEIHFKNIRLAPIK